MFIFLAETLQFRSLSVYICCWLNRILQEDIINHSVLPQEINARLEQFTELFGSAVHPFILQIQFDIKSLPSLRLLKHLSGTGSKQFYFSRPDENYSLTGIGSVLEKQFSGSSRLEEAEDFFIHWKNYTQYIGQNGSKEQSDQIFLFQSTFFPEAPGDLWSGFAPVSLVLPKFLIQSTEDKTALSINLLVRPHSSFSRISDDLAQGYSWIISQIQVLDNQSTIPGQPEEVSHQPVNSDRWTELVQRGVDGIKEQRFEKVVLSSQLRLRSSRQFNVYDITQRLELNYPNCTTFLLRNETGKTFLGATPEEFAQVKNGILHCDALAGSIQRGDSEFEDMQLGRELLESEKDRAEHRYVVEFLKHTLQSLVTTLSYPDSPDLLRLQNVQHLYTPFEGNVRQDTSLFQIIEKLHPTPAVGGIPVQRAVEFIAGHENYERGCYASPLGFLTSAGEMDLVVGLRSGLFDGNHATLFAGAGIVEDSDPAIEYDEIMMKFKPMLTAIQPQDFHAESLQ